MSLCKTTLYSKKKKIIRAKRENETDKQEKKVNEIQLCHDMVTCGRKEPHSMYRTA